MLWELIVVYGISTGQPIQTFTEPMRTRDECLLIAMNTNIEVDPSTPGSIMIYCRPRNLNDNSTTTKRM